MEYENSETNFGIRSSTSKPCAYYDRQRKMWIVRLAEIVAANTKEEAEAEAELILQIYADAKRRCVTP